MVAAKFHEEPGVFKLLVRKFNLSRKNPSYPGEPSLTQLVIFKHFFKVIDSIMALFRVDFCGRGELADRQQKLAQMLSRLQKISEGNHLTQTLNKGQSRLLVKW